MYKSKKILSFGSEGRGKSSIMSDFWNPMDYTVHEISPDKKIEWVAFPFLQDLPQPRDRTSDFTKLSYQ